MSTFLEPEPICDYDKMFEILKRKCFTTEAFVQEFGDQYRPKTEKRTFDTWEAISRKTDLLAAVKNGNSIELSTFRLAYVRKPEAAKDIHCLQFTQCIDKFKFLITSKLFHGNSNAFEDFIAKEITTLNNYRKALLYVCHNETQVKKKELDEVLEFQPFFGVYIRQLIARLSLTPGGNYLSNRKVDAANKALFSTSIDVTIAKKVKEDYQLNQLENNSGNSPVGSNGVCELLSAQLTSQLVTVPAPAAKTGCNEIVVDVKLCGYTDLVVLDLSLQTTLENIIQSKSAPIPTPTEEIAIVDGSEVNYCFQVSPVSFIYFVFVFVRRVSKGREKERLLKEVKGTRNPDNQLWMSLRNRGNFSAPPAILKSKDHWISCPAKSRSNSRMGARTNW
jgi:hypothetical protein